MYKLPMYSHHIQQFITSNIILFIIYNFDTYLVYNIIFNFSWVFNKPKCWIGNYSCYLFLNEKHNIVNINLKKKTNKNQLNKNIIGKTDKHRFHQNEKRLVIVSAKSFFLGHEKIIIWDLRTTSTSLVIILVLCCYFFMVSVIKLQC